jgi:hypothetical protein
MNLTEERLRTALHETANELPAVRQLELPSEGSAMNSRRRPARAWLPAVAAAAAVCLIAGLSVAVANGHRSPRPAAAVGLALRAIPRYYAALVAYAYTRQSGYYYQVEIKDSRTGATLATARPPVGFDSFTYVTGAANDRTFALAAVRPGRSNVERLFRAQFSPDGNTLMLAQLPMNPGISLNGIALSPNGADLAIDGQTGPRDLHFEVSVIPMRGGPVKTWTARGGAQSVPAPMSFARDGMLVFTGLIRVATKEAKNLWLGGLWLLDTRTAGGSLGADSRLLLGRPDYGWSLTQAVMSSGGALVTVSARRIPRRGFYVSSGEFREYSVATGKLTRVLWPVHVGPATAPLGPRLWVWWSNSSGSVLVVLANTRHGDKSTSRALDGVLIGNRLVPLPGSGAQNSYNAGGFAF